MSDAESETGVAHGQLDADKHESAYKTAAAKRVEEFDEFPGATRDRPWTDGQLLEELYVDRRLSMNQIRDGWGCSGSTVSKWLEEHGIEKRSRSEAAQNAYGSLKQVRFHTDRRGREIWSSGDFTLVVHRLVAVAEYGVEAVKDMHVHHQSGIPWDNRPRNLELLTNSEHQQKHLKVEGIDRIRLAELYENGDASIRRLAEIVDHDITPSTVLDVHHGFYGGEA